MAFVLQNVNRTSSGANANAPAFYSYVSTTDNAAAIVAAGYFDDFATSLRIGDNIYAKATDGPGFMEVTAVTPQVTVAAIATIAPGGVGTAQLQALAVTTAILDNLAVTTGKIADDAVTSAKLDPTTIQYVKVAVSTAEFKALYTTGKALLAAGGANTLHVVRQVAYEFDYGAAQYTAGGVLFVQYDVDINAAGAPASATVAAAVVNAVAADTVIGAAGSLASAAAADTVNKALWLVNATADFATGDTPVDVHLWYSTVTTTL